MKKNNRVNLEVKFDARQSFYGKAKIERVGKTIHLYSYETFIASATPNENGKYEIFDDNGNKINDIKDCKGWSQTTNRHYREFFKQFNGEYENYAGYNYGI